MRKSVKDYMRKRFSSHVCVYNVYISGSSLSARYVSGMLKAFDYRWSELVTNHHDVVLLSFHIGDARKPLLHLMHRIEEYVEEHAQLFTAPELALICHAFFTNNTAFRRYTVHRSRFGFIFGILQCCNNIY